MLEHLLIKNFAIIEDLEIDFSNGFLAITGETGAGKSIIIDALGLLMGNRSSFGKIRHDKTKAYIEGVFSFSCPESKEKIKKILQEDLDEDILIISRSLDINSKTQVKINSHIVSMIVLKQVSEVLLDIHSQQKDSDYLFEDNQLALLDKFISSIASDKEKETFRQYTSLYDAYKKKIQEINDFKNKINQFGDIDYLKYQLDELTKANLIPHEMEDLEEESKKLSSFTKMSENLGEFLHNYEEAKSFLYHAKKSLDRINDEDLNLIINRYNDFYYELEDIYQVINDKMELYSDSLQILDYINERLFFLHSLRKKYGYTTEDMLTRLENIKNDIDEITNAGFYQEKLNSELKNLEDDLLNKSKEISDIRKRYALILSHNVCDQLKDLYLENADFKIDFLLRDDFSLSGKDQIRFLLKANAGGAFLPLDKTASLGETSRLNLALKAVFNQISPKETIIFDEIDIGVSGKVGIAISKKMREISSKSQVITISHLPQVCAGADVHYYVSKEVISGQTYASITCLDEQQRLHEIARMLSGNQVTEASLNASKDLINSFSLPKK